MSKAKLPWDRRYMSFMEGGRRYFVFPRNSSPARNGDALAFVPEEVRKAHANGELEEVHASDLWDNRIVLRSVTIEADWPRVAVYS